MVEKAWQGQEQLTWSFQQGEGKQGLAVPTSRPVPSDTLLQQGSTSYRFCNLSEQHHQLGINYSHKPMGPFYIQTTTITNLPIFNFLKTVKKKFSSQGARLLQYGWKEDTVLLHNKVILSSEWDTFLQTTSMCSCTWWDARGRNVRYGQWLEFMQLGCCTWHLRWRIGIECYRGLEESHPCRR